MSTWILSCHSIWSNARSSHNPQSFISFRIIGVHAIFGLPFSVASLRKISSHLLIGALRGLHYTCSVNLKWFSHFLYHRSDFHHLRCLFIVNFIFSSFMHIHLNIRISAALISIFVLSGLTLSFVQQRGQKSSYKNFRLT